MFDLVVDPLLYLLFLAAYVIGFVDPEEASGRKDRWTFVADTSFWAAAAFAAALLMRHGPLGCASALVGAWGLSIVGVRRGILAQRNILWESPLWTMPLELLMAGGGSMPHSLAVADDEVVSAQPVRARPPSQVRTIEWRLPALADLLPNRGRRLTMLGIAMDLAACVVVMSALSLALR